MRTTEILHLAQPSARRFAPGALLGLLSALCAVGLLATSAYLITRAAEMPPILYLNMAIVGVRAFALGRAGFRYADRLASHDAAFRTLATLRVGIYERLVPLAPDGLAGTRRGDLLTRLTADVDELQNLPLRVVQPLLISGAVAVASVVTVWILLPAAGIALLVALLLAALVGTAANSLIAARSERSIAPLRGAFADEVLDTVVNLDVLTAFDATDERLAAVERADARLTRAVLSSAAGSGVATGILSLLAGAASVAALLMGIPALGSSGFDGPVLAIIALVPIAVFEVISSVPLAMPALRQVRSSAERIGSAVPDDVPPEIPLDRPTSAIATVDASNAVIELRGVSASWPQESSPAIRGIDLTVSPGDRILVTGASGSGKTTLAHVLVRFLEFEGSYRLGGVDVRSLPLAEVRRTIGLSEQTPYLFDESIRQNLLFARDDASDDDLIAVLERVGLTEWVERRGGLDARVGERGSLVSGGQAQRIALARALLADFPVLVLDEPTANVDPGRADALLRDLLSASADPDGRRAVVIISHLPVPAELITGRLRLG
ncbi:thiol reductant ABC exporter subunit CydC [Agreia sp. VKM Ac-1783]|uniref:thiol reductant ABC exporter subunit CydC n=1 Tax=Agreia sp. VKM Ac-1783 TaxID=1938889 RepID=UPI000A2AD242|nr:thiol reductant ABC exporter subunit CydC [Agreia sp. VKM Ac-1783]SMQ63618.1 ATP-binding cassette, subfamily C, CydC [Agreia sp. VKM Ac-1783]